MNDKLLDYKERFTTPTHSSREWERSPRDERDHLVDAESSKVYNTTLDRFEPKYWHLYTNPEMTGAILPFGSRSMIVPVAWRSNKDTAEVTWSSRDLVGHALFSYEHTTDYTGQVLAFRHNPEDPEHFFAKIRFANEPEEKIIRLEPQVWDGASSQFGSWPESIIEPTGFIVPKESIVPVSGSQNYIYVLDFGSLGHLAAQVESVSFLCRPAEHGLGSSAVCSAIGAGQITVTQVGKGAQLTEWDILTVGGVKLEVTEYAGFGSGEFSVACTGNIQPSMVGEAVYYEPRQGVPVQPAERLLCFADMTVTGGVKTVGLRHYPQTVNKLGRQINLDEVLTLTPERVVEEAFSLGLVGGWVTDLGTRYFGAKLEYTDKVTGAKTSSNSATAPDMKPDPDAYTIDAEITGPISDAAHWYLSRLNELFRTFGMSNTITVGNSLGSFYHPAEWSQVDYADRHEPHVPPTDVVANGFISDALSIAAQIAEGESIEPRVMVQASWYMGGSPYIYDTGTQAGYGSPVPLPLVQDYRAPVADNQIPYLEYLRDSVGTCLQTMKTAIQLDVPGTKVGVLVNTVNAISPEGQLPHTVNFPRAHIGADRFDFVGLVDRPYVLDGATQQLAMTHTVATDVLGYAAENVQYLFPLVPVFSDVAWGVSQDAITGTNSIEGIRDILVVRYSDCGCLPLPEDKINISLCTLLDERNDPLLDENGEPIEACLFLSVE